MAEAAGDGYTSRFMDSNPASCRGAIHLSTMCDHGWMMHGGMMMMMETVGLLEPRVLVPCSNRCLKRPELCPWYDLVPRGSMEWGCEHLMQTAKA